MKLTPRRAVSALAAAAVLAAPALTAGAANAAMPGPGEVGRIAGSTRWSTAELISREMAGVHTVYIATGENYPDALAAGAVAAGTFDTDTGLGRASVLLTKQAALPAATQRELTRLRDQGQLHEVVIVGAESAISAAVAEQIAAASGVTPQRVAGTNRYATAARLAERAENPYGVAYLATGEGFADALSAGWVAGVESAPVLLTPAATLSGYAKRYLEQHEIGAVVIVGGPSVVSDDVADAVAALPAGPKVIRIAGSDRYGTSARLSAFARDELEIAAAGVTLTTGEDFPDALAGTPLAVEQGSSVLLTRQASIPGVIDAETATTKPAYGLILGGTDVVSTDVEARLDELVTLPVGGIVGKAGAQRMTADR